MVYENQRWYKKVKIQQIKFALIFKSSFKNH